jgi:biotin operon repressor
MKNIECISCGERKLSKNIIGLNIKLLGSNIENYYCLDCLAEYLEVSVDELLDKIEEFKEEGCKLFE